MLECQLEKLFTEANLQKTKKIILLQPSDSALGGVSFTFFAIAGIIIVVHLIQRENFKII